MSAVMRLWSRGDRKKSESDDLAKYRWIAGLQDFPLATRYHAANLASHDWDVTLVGDRLLISCRWSGGHWITKDGERTEISDAEWDALYPRVNGRAEQRISDLQVQALNPSKDKDQ